MKKTILTIIGILSMVSLCACESTLPEERDEVVSAENVAEDFADDADTSQVSENTAEISQEEDVTNEDSEENSGEDIYGGILGDYTQEEAQMPDSEAFFAYISQNGQEYSELYFEDENSFLDAYGFADAEPFFEYFNPDGTLQMVLYYDEENDLGCGIFMDLMIGFSFSGTAQESWTGYRMDYEIPPNNEEYTGALAKTEDDLYGVTEYSESTEWDEEGRVINYVGRGVLDEGYTGEESSEPRDIITIHWEYDEETGLLTQRSYWRSAAVFATAGHVVESYFDEKERLEYEGSYITHGWYHVYYIYEGENTIPTYSLILDEYTGIVMPRFTRWVE